MTLKEIDIVRECRAKLEDILATHRKDMSAEDFNDRAAGWDDAALALAVEALGYAL